jgi:hypothetical protein
VTAWAATLFPYALLATTGAYLAGAVALLLRRWNPPAQLPGWFVLLAILAFGVDREMPQYAIEAAPLFCVCAIVIGTRIIRSPSILGLRNLLWSLFALIPIAFMFVISTADFFPATDANAMRTSAAALLAVPGIAALAGAFARVISPAPRT